MQASVVMFTGIVEAVGEVVEVGTGPGGRRLWVRSPALAGAATGASVAVNGVCLTVAEGQGEVRGFDLSPETLERTTLGLLGPGDRVNLERPVRAGAELGGHLVQGHVDGRGTVVDAVPEGGGRRLRIRVPPALCRYLVQKGSVAVDGVSLTVAGVRGEEFEVALVPHTLAVTTLGSLRPGHQVNVEVDILAKYVEKLVGAGPPEPLEAAGEEPGYL